MASCIGVLMSKTPSSTGRVTIVVRLAAFRASDFGVMFSRFFGIMFRHLFGVILSHFFEEGGENMSASFT